VADQLEIATKTLKNWEDRGWIPKARLNKFGWRRWTRKEFEALKELVVKNDYFKKRRSSGR
jgi:DNA-binding transcriptional MerR regulator